jgi:hypothetical protein
LELSYLVYLWQEELSPLLATSTIESASQAPQYDCLPIQLQQQSWLSQLAFPTQSQSLINQLSLVLLLI